MFEEIQNHQNMVRDNILKGFNPDLGVAIEENALFNKGEIEYDEFQKAVYADTAENRKLGRVGQEWGKKKSQGTSQKELKSKKDALVAEYSQLRKKKLSGGGLSEQERDRYGKLEREINSISLQSTRRNPTKKGDIERRLAALKDNINNLSDEEKKEYAELRGRLLDKKMQNVHPEKTDDTYPSRQEEKEIKRMMQDDGLDPDEQSEKTWNKYYKKLKQD